MKINFKRVSVRNFLSIGNTDIVLDYTRGINLVTGTNIDNGSKNGIGKSAVFVDAISFGLYGKPLRGSAINKDDVVNKINKKDCEVSVDFDIGVSEYTVKRTIKPNALVVYENGTEIKFDSMKNTQEWLENKLSINHSCFANIITLNLNNSKPFLSMEAAEKRTVIENILSLKTFSNLAEVAKNKQLTAKGEVKSLEVSYKNSLDTLNRTNKQLEVYNKDKELFESNKSIKIATINKELEQATVSISELTKRVTDIDYDDLISKLNSSLLKVEEAYTKGTNKLSELNVNIRNYTETLHTLESTPHCPTCKTPTDNPIIATFIQDTKKAKELADSEYKILKDKLTIAITKIKNIKSEISNNNGHKNFQVTLKNKIEVIKNNIKNINEKLKDEQAKEFVSSSPVTLDELKLLSNTTNELEFKYNSLSTELTYSTVLRQILSEEGVRKFVLSKLLPYFNSKITSYLRIMGSDLSLSFNTNLEESITSKNRETRAYATFSGGERKRIDIAILLSLIDLAKIQNSIDTNLLILDEILDTAMDNDGVTSLLTFLKDGFKVTYPDKCVYIISHRKEISDDFYDKMISLVKRNGFTKIESITDFTIK